MACRPSLLIPALCVLLAAPSARADEWWGVDKAQHLGISLALGSALYGTLWALSADSRQIRLTFSLGIALLPGLAKELYDDGQPGNAFSGKDMAFNLIGAAIGCGVLWGVEMVIGRGKKPRGRPQRVGLAWVW